MDEPTSIQPASEIKREEYLTMAQAARVSGYQQDYLGQMAREGKLKAIKSGHHWITTRSAIENLALAHRKMKSASPTVTPSAEAEVKSEIENPIPEPVKQSVVPPAAPDPGVVHSMHTPVATEDLPHAPTIPLNI